MPTRIRVIAYICEPIGREISSGNFENLVLYVGRHPGERAVTDDVVEGPNLLTEVEDIPRQNHDVAQPQFADQLTSLLDLRRRRVDTDEATPGHCERDRNQV